jgi:hypothetical protein
VPEQTKNVVVTAKDCALSSRTIVMTMGQGLEVRNADTGATRTYYAMDLAVSRGPAMRVIASGSDSVLLYPKKPGGDVLEERMGKPFMRADVLVATTPNHAVTDSAGHYRIDGIPVGALQASVLHTAPGMTGIGAPVTIEANKVTHLDLTVTYATPAATVASTPPRPSASAKASGH